MFFHGCTFAVFSGTGAVFCGDGRKGRVGVHMALIPSLEGYIPVIYFYGGYSSGSEERIFNDSCVPRRYAAWFLVLNLRIAGRNPVFRHIPGIWRSSMAGSVSVKSCRYCLSCAYRISRFFGNMGKFASTVRLSNSVLDGWYSSKFRLFGHLRFLLYSGEILQVSPMRGFFGFVLQ